MSGYLNQEDIWNLFTHTTILIWCIPYIAIITIRSTPCFIKFIVVTNTTIQVQKVWCIVTLFFFFLRPSSYCWKSRTSGCLDRKKIMRITYKNTGEKKRNLPLANIDNRKHKRALSELLGVRLDMYSQSW